MKPIPYPCTCGGQLNLSKERVVQSGIDCGILEIESCEKCEAQYLPEESMAVVENHLKQHGLWGTERKEVKFWKTGSAVTIRIPSQLTKQLRLDKAKRGFAYKDGENKLAIEY